MKPTILVHRNHLIRPSETFIQSQVENLEKFNALYVGLRTVPGNNLPPKQVVTIPRHHIWQRPEAFAYKLSSRHSTFFRTIAQKTPVLVHAHFGPDGVKAIPLSKSLNLPLIVTFHGYDITLKNSFAWRSSYSYLMYIVKRGELKKVASRFIAVSEFIKSKLIQKGFPSDKINVHYIGVDTQKFSCSLSQKREPIVLFAGRLIEVKGCEFLIRAMAKVQRALPRSRLVILGDGPLRKKLEKLASKTLTNYQFLGFQPSSAVKYWMACSRVFCVPSISTQNGHTEAFGTVFLEAQSMGLPVVSSLSGGISEAVKHEKTGFLTAERDVEELANSILILLQNESLWYQMSRDAIERTKSRFDIRKQTKKLEAIYADILIRK